MNSSLQRQLGFAANLLQANIVGLNATAKALWVCSPGLDGGNHMDENKSITDLVDLDTIEVNPDLPQEQRCIEFLRQVKDPFNVRCGKYIIRGRFPKNGTHIEDILISMKA